MAKKHYLCSPENEKAMMQEYQMIAKTFKGLEEVLAGELVRLGADNVQTERRAVSFTGDKRLMYKANLWLRTASRVLMPIASFRAKDADEVYEQVKQMDWERYMSVDTSFAIDTTVFSEVFRHSRYVTYRVKDAIADRFMERCGSRPSVRVNGAELYINVHIAEDRVTVSLDSSGESLHKRGWRSAQTAAPINEALAAGMLLMAGWRGETDLVDPMCGSGTFLIEGAMIALNIPPGIYRQGFAFEKWNDFDSDLFEELYNDDSEERPFAHHIYGSDASFYAVRAAEQNVKSAGLQKYITLRQCPLQSLPEHPEPCLLFANPPYGERMEPADIMALYDDLGSALKHKFAGSVAWVVSSNEEALKRIGLRPGMKVKLLNGDLECLFLRYDLFKGRVEDWKAARNAAPRKTEAPRASRSSVARSSHASRPAREERAPREGRPSREKRTFGAERRSPSSVERKRNERQGRTFAGKRRGDDKGSRGPAPRNYRPKR